jgi:hypothetical protein
VSARKQRWAGKSRARTSGCSYLRWISLCIATAASYGCMTENVVLPDATPVATVAGGTPIGLAEVKDARSTTDAGSAGLATFRAGTELDDYLRKGMASRLAGLNFTVIDAPSPSQKATQSVVVVKGKVIELTLVSAEASTMDAILQASDCQVVFAAEVYDTSGQAVYQQHYRGTDQERLSGVSLNPMKAQGKVLAMAVDAGLNQALQDQEFLKAIR